MLIADAVYTAWVDAGKPILLDISQENSPAQIERWSEHNELIVSNKNKKGNARSNNKNQKKKRENKDNANVSNGDKRKISKSTAGSVVACIVAFIAAYLFKYRRKRKKKKQ